MVKNLRSVGIYEKEYKLVARVTRQKKKKNKRLLGSFLEARNVIIAGLTFGSPSVPLTYSKYLFIRFTRLHYFF